MEKEMYIESAKEVAGKAIGKNGLVYITLIVARSEERRVGKELLAV